MNKSAILHQLQKHPHFQVEMSQKATASTLFNQLCQLEGWKPLEVVPSTHSDWYLVASSSEIGVWHRTSVINSACDCGGGRIHQCRHLSAAMAHEESQWIADVAKYGFVVSVSDGNYQLTDRITQSFVGELSFEESNWWLMEPRKADPMRFDGVHEAIEYLAAVASFGNQIGT